MPGGRVLQFINFEIKVFQATQPVEDAGRQLRDARENVQGLQRREVIEYPRRKGVIGTTLSMRHP